MFSSFLCFLMCIHPFVPPKLVSPLRLNYILNVPWVSPTDSNMLETCREYWFEIHINKCHLIWDLFKSVSIVLWLLCVVGGVYMDHPKWKASFVVNVCIFLERSLISFIRCQNNEVYQSFKSFFSMPLFGRYRNYVTKQLA